ncbi:unnamed protein product [Danaus chrysippus]|uniref:(African queen) hypothetical protein n=1 Tax=Danaus chrysippus TaxID=151541 RepID=A0A8J2Q9N5_9NEOP|nr:unnamed protein product [Danaus chrysippus]
MAESRSQSPKNERPEIAVTDTEDDRESLCPPPSGPSTRSTSKRKTPRQQNVRLPKSTVSVQQQQNVRLPKSTVSVQQQQNVRLPKSTVSVQQQQNVRLPMSTVSVQQQQNVDLPKSSA